jgi:arylsulfatase A-like enzyme
MGSHHLLAKCVMYEEATRIPLLLRLPGMRKPARLTRPISQIDLVPTLLDLMGETIPPGLSGRSLKNEIETGIQPNPENVYIEWNGKETGILEYYEKHPLPPSIQKLANREELIRVIQDPLRTIVTPDRWKYSHSQIGMHELYDLNKDPYETTNLYHHPENHSRVNEMKKAIIRWQKQTSDIIQPIDG